MTLTIEDVAKQVQKWQEQGSTVALATGVFDLLHIEHLRFLQKAKSNADKLIVGLETDQRVRMIKGEHRPINQQDVRLEQLSNLKSVDLVFLLPKAFSIQSEWEALIKKINPTQYVVSSHTNFLENKKNICMKSDVHFQIVHQHNPEYSTTKLVEEFQKVATDQK